MHTDADLPLFSWKPPACVVIPFPASKRTGKIRRAAEVLVEKSGKGADQYWKQVISGMRSQMERAGIPQSAIDTELQAFFDAVQSELVRLTYRGRRPGGDAA